VPERIGAVVNPLTTCGLKMTTPRERLARRLQASTGPPRLRVWSERHCTVGRRLPPLGLAVLYLIMQSSPRPRDHPGLSRPSVTAGRLCIPSASASRERRHVAESDGSEHRNKSVHPIPFPGPSWRMGLTRSEENPSPAQEPRYPYRGVPGRIQGSRRLSTRSKNPSTRSDTYARFWERSRYSTGL